MLKSIITRVATLYAANGKFHLFVNSMLVGAGTGISTAFIGGIPLDKQGWLVVGGVIVGALKAALTGYLRTAIASVSIQGVSPGVK